MCCTSGLGNVLGLGRQVSLRISDRDPRSFIFSGYRPLSSKLELKWHQGGGIFQSRYHRWTDIGNLLKEEGRTLVGFIANQSASLTQPYRRIVFFVPSSQSVKCQRVFQGHASRSTQSPTSESGGYISTVSRPIIPC